MKYTLRVLSLLTCLLPTLLCAQQPPEFAISTTRSYAPGETPKVAAYYRGVNMLDFRIYRVQDPVALFSRMKDPHQFGDSRRRDLLYNYRDRGEAPIVTIHTFKRDLRSRIRAFFRDQLSPKARQAYRESRPAGEHTVVGPGRRRIMLNGASFAAVPVLNPQRLVMAWREILPMSRENQREVLPINVREPGVYLIEAVNDRLAAYAVLVITDLAVVTKSAPQQMLVYTVDRRTGKPAPNTDLLLYRMGERLAEGRSDNDGLFKASLAAIDDPNEEPSAGVLVMARASGRFAVSALQPYEVSSGSAGELRAYIQTDRPVYRPGHKVHFKGIVRNNDRGRYITPTGSVTVVIQGPEHTPVFNQEYRLNQFGSFSGTFDITPESALGTHNIEVMLDGRQAGYFQFRVEEYRKPEFEVKVSLDRPQYLQGDKIRASISAQYYFGSPVSGAIVKWLVFRTPYWPPYWMEYLEDANQRDDGEGSDLGEGFEGRYWNPPEQLHEQEATLDADGRLQVEFPTTPDAQGKNYTYRVEARVTDTGDREVSGAGGATLLYSDAGVFGRTDRYIYNPSDSVEVSFRALELTGKPLQTQLELRVVKQTWSGNQRHESELLKTTLRSDANGVARYSYKPAGAGSFEFIAQMTDARGRVVSGRTWAWVWAQGYDWPRDEYTSARIKLVPDKKKYKPGETARVLISLPEEDGYVLVTAEGQQVYSSWIRHSRSRAFTIDIPIQGNLSPNFYVAAAFVKNNKLYEGSRSISVPADEKRLSIELLSDRSQYAPGQQAAYTLLVRDADGKPASAEVSVGVVDEAIYAVRPDNAPDIHKFFYAHRYSRVMTRFSAYYHFYGFSSEKRVELVFARRPYRLSDFKAEGEEPVRVRKRFLDTAFWDAHVTTDRNGRAQMRLTVPDNLTTWRATARAVTADTRAGSGVLKVVARKNLMLRLQTPRFFTERDTATVVGVVHNYLAAPATAKVRLEANGMELMSAGEHTVTVPKDGTARVEWRVKAFAPGEAVFLAKALSAEESDALEWRVPVRPYGLAVTTVRNGQISDDGAETTRFTLSSSNRASNSLRIDLAPSAAGTMLSALDYLTSFPYGCVEQTMSSFLPNVVVARTVKDLKLPPLPNPEDLARKVTAGLKRLYSLQHDDGGWGWWTDDDTHPFMTAYVIYGLREAQLAGYEVRADVMQRGLESLGRQLAVSPASAPHAPELRAYMIYAMVSADPRRAAPIDVVFNERQKLSPMGKALLALALAARKDARATELAAELERLATSVEGETYWSSQVDPMLLHGTRDNSIEASAYAVRALSALRPGSALLPRAVSWLVAHRRGGYYWNTTLTTATVIFGITDYLRRSRELEADYQLEVLLNGKLVLARAITRADALKLQPLTLRLGAERLEAGENQLEVRKRGAGTLYWSAVATHYAGGDNIGAAQRSDLRVTREYFQVVSEKRGDRYVYLEEPLDGKPVRVGDLVSVRLNVNGSGWEYVLLEDPLPAGFEPVERDDLFQFERAPDWYTAPWWTRRELRDDRVVFFQTWFGNRGELHYRYLMRAGTAGEFQAMPAKVQPMYQPEVQATTSNARVTIQGAQP